MPGTVGILTNNPVQEHAKTQVATMVRSMLHEPSYSHGTYAIPELGCYLGWVNHKGSYSDSNPVVNRTRDVILIFSGEHFAHPGTQPSSPSGRSTSADLLALYEAKGEAFLSDLNGWFAGLIVDLRTKTVLLFNDRFGMHRTYYYEAGDSFVCSSEAKAVLAVRPATRQLDPDGLAHFLGFGTVFDNRTLFSGVRLLPAGSAWRFTRRRDVAKRLYFDRSTWENQTQLEPEEFYSALKSTVARILPTYFRATTPIGISLTGGLDTRIVTAGVPESGAQIPCYTYGGIYRDCFDVQVAQEVARACGLTHHVLRLGSDFFEDFAAYADKTILATDGCLDICGAHEVYYSKQARALAPIRLTGNYGSEVLRSVSTFKYNSPPHTLFDPSLRPHLADAHASYGRFRAGHGVTFSAFGEVPWHLHGRLAAAQSQLLLRSPFMDNELVALMYRARPEIRQTSDISWRLIAALKPSIATIKTDMGYGVDAARLSARARRLYRYALFKAEWYYNAGMPEWLTRFDRNALFRTAEPLFLGSHKIEHYRLWFRDQLRDYVQSILSDQVAQTRAYLNRSAYQDLVRAHARGTTNRISEISRLITLELVQRLLIESSHGQRNAAELSCH